MAQHDTALPELPVRGLIGLCRAGFENDLAAELDETCCEHGLIGFARATRDHAFACFEVSTDTGWRDIDALLDWRRTVFARQLLGWFEVLDLPERGDRAGPIAEAVRGSGQRFSNVVIEQADSDTARSLSGFGKRFHAPLLRALEKLGTLRRSRTGLPVLHVVFVGPTRVYLAAARPGQAHPEPGGILRVRMPSNAPSRSTLKLAEAFATMLDDAEREQRLRAGMRAVDLGAAPGGWSWQLAWRGIHTVAIDNGQVAQEVLGTGMVSHLRADGFIWRPPHTVDWMVCDMVEQPARIATLASDWIAQRHCRHTLFNLKLPMKRRRDAVEQCRELIGRRLRTVGRHTLRIRHLYHDREEVTAMLWLD